MVLICHMISEDHVIEESCDFIGRISSRLFHILPSLVATGTVVVEI